MCDNRAGQLNVPRRSDRSPDWLKIKNPKHAAVKREARMPIARTRALNAAPNARSLSRTRYFGAVSHGNASVIWRANHSAVELPVTANHSNCKTCKELLKRNRRDHEQIDRRNAFGMIVDEGLRGGCNGRPHRGTM